MRLDHITPKQFAFRVVCNAIDISNPEETHDDLPISLSIARRLSGIERYGLSGGYSEREPPDPISNSVVKPFSADDSVG